MLVRSTVAAARPQPFLPAATTESRRATPRPVPTTPQRPGGDSFEPGKPPRFEGLKDKALVKALNEAFAKHKDIG